MFRVNSHIFSLLDFILKIIGGIRKKLSFPRAKWVIGGVILLGFFFFWAKQFLISPSPVLVTIPQGANSQQIAQMLYGKGLISSPFLFQLWTKIKGEENKLKAGDYLLHRRMSMSTILNKLVKGEIFYRPLTLPEGYSAAQVASLLAGEGYGDRDKFLELVNDKNLCQELGIPASNLEGYLFPDTYYFTLDMDEERIIRLMVARFWEVFRPYQERIREIGLSLHQAVILASIIEREAKLPPEKSIISAVFHNRLRRNMPLESCSTVIYALGGKKEQLFEKDLQIKSPYNTYLHRGLPPGPISNSGQQALEAALYPAKVNYLYFVSRNDGSHAFTADYQEFLWLKRKYRRNNG